MFHDLLSDFDTVSKWDRHNQ